MTEQASRALIKLADFLDVYLPMINVCMVDFIIKDHFENLTPEVIKEELLSLSDSEIAELPNFLINKSKLESNDSD